MKHVIAAKLKPAGAVKKIPHISSVRARKEKPQG